MEIDSNLVALREQAESAIATYDQFKESAYEPSHNRKTRIALESIERELLRLKNIHDSWCRETHTLPLRQHGPMDAEMREALRGMSPKQRDAILADPSSGALMAVVDVPAWLSGITVEQQRQLQEAEIVRRYADDWKQQAIDAAAMKEIQTLVQGALQNLPKMAA